jgi:NADH:ubiquinone oxidoreductase subunit E
MATAPNDEKLQSLRAFMAEALTKERPESQLIAVLHRAQGLYGYLTREAMDAIADTMGIPTAHIWGVATFYHFFSLTPKGRHTLSVCMGTACYVKGAQTILDAIREELKITMGGTTSDGLFTLQDTRCLGTCGLAPVMMIDDKVFGELTPKKVIEILRQYRAAAAREAA